MKKIVFSTIAVIFLLWAGKCTFMENSGTSECRPEFIIPPKDMGIQYLEFMAVGDAGSGKEGQRIVAHSMREYAIQNSVEFVLYLGDNFYDNGVNSVNDPKFQTHFEQIYDNIVLNMPFYVVVGNHDYRGDVYAQIAYTERSTRWYMPALYYTFTIEYNESDSVQFFALNTNPISEGEDVTEQLTWLEDMLHQSEARWKIVYGHHPIYSNGYHGNDANMIHHVLPILETHDVDIYLSGHDHDLQILKPVNGIHYLVNGAGSELRDTLCKDNSIYAASYLGFMAFRISHNEMVVSVVLDEGKLDYCHVILK
jgi:acid phosphatase